MPSENPQDAPPSRARGAARWLPWVWTALAAALGLVAGYGFGARLAGPLVGVVTALNAAVICALLADAAWHRLPRWLLRPRRG